MNTIEPVPIIKINPAPYNPRKDLQPGEPEYEQIKNSINQFGCVAPLVWNRRTGNLVGGHQRFKVLVARGDKEVQCSVVDLSPEQEKALNLALNKISGEWDKEKLAELLKELTELPEFDVGLTGFDAPEVSQLFDRFLGPDEDSDDNFDVEQELESIKQPETKLGDIFELGPHRILCGNSAKPEDVAKLMDGKKAQLVCTDPPYAVDYRGGRVGKEWEHKIRKDGEKYWDSMSSAEYLNLINATLLHADEFSDDRSALYIWFASMRLAEVIESLSNSIWVQRNLIVWVKNTFAGSLRAQYKHQYEPLLYCFKDGKSPRWYGPTNETTTWFHDKPHKNEGHPTVKPLALIERCIRNASARGDIVLDFFMGSGTTLIAAERMGRIAYGMELEPKYCDLIKKRYEQLKGTTPQPVAAEMSLTNGESS